MRRHRDGLVRPERHGGLRHGQARGAALVACAEGGLAVGEYTPRQIKLAVVGEGSAEKEQVQYMVRHLLSLDRIPEPDHAADALGGGHLLHDP